MEFKSLNNFGKALCKKHFGKIQQYWISGLGESV